MSAYRSGLAAGLAAYLLWGLAPLYWPLIDQAGSLEILAHRMVWSLVFLGLVLVATAGFAWIRKVDRRRVGLLAIAAVLITINWGTFIYGVNAGHVVEVSLGYFIGPLVSVGIGVVVLHERLTPRQWIAVAIAAIAVGVLTVDYGRPPWIAVTLAVSFALYGFVKKRIGMDGTTSLAIETILLAPVALAYLALLEGSGEGTFATDGLDHAALLAAGGIVTAVPLMLFGAAAIRIPLTTLGLLQYVGPVMQFLIGVLIYDEAMPASRLIGFALVWLALVIFTYDALRAVQRGRASARLDAQAATATG